MNTVGDRWKHVKQGWGDRKGERVYNVWRDRSEAPGKKKGRKRCR